MKSFRSATALPVICVMLFFCSAGFSSAEEWRVRAAEDNAGRIFLVVENNLIKARFVERHAWKLGEVFYNGREMVGIYGSNGSVLSVERDAAWERPQATWLGAGHGGEKVESYVIEADGKPHPFTEDINLSGREIRLVKKAVKGPFIFNHVVYFPSSGDYIVQEHGYRVFRDSTGFNYMYAFMHCNSKGFDEWLAVLPDGTRKQGVADKGDNSRALMEKTILSVSFYNRAGGMGVSYSYPEAYPGSRWGNHIWDRPRDTKLYFRPELPAEFQIGDEFSFRIKLVPFLADADSWEEKALASADF